jgi:hypothetical protein
MPSSRVWWIPRDLNVPAFYANRFEQRHKIRITQNEDLLLLTLSLIRIINSRLAALSLLQRVTQLAVGIRQLCD